MMKNDRHEKTPGRGSTSGELARISWIGVGSTVDPRAARKSAGGREIARLSRATRVA